MDVSIVVGPIPTPWGTFGAAVSSRGLGRLTFPDEPIAHCHAWAARCPVVPPGTTELVPPPGPLPSTGESATGLAPIGSPERVFRAVADQLDAYLRGTGRDFSLPLDLRGTPFQRQVWLALLQVGYGQTRSYADIAASIGRPLAIRAVGAANGSNPIPIVIPCHRVIGGDGSLTGYGGGLPLKERLLKLEGASVKGTLPNRGGATRGVATPRFGEIP